MKSAEENPGVIEEYLARGEARPGDWPIIQEPRLTASG